MSDLDNNQGERGASVSAVLDLSLVAKHKGPEGETIGSWELLDRLIPRGNGPKTVAYYMHCATKYVQAWCREPENEGGTGQPNPIDRLCHLIEAIFMVNPLGAAFIPEFIVNHHRQLVSTHQAVGFGGSEQRRDNAASLLRAATKAVNALNTTAATDETLFALVELSELCAQMIEKNRVELSTRGIAARA